MQEEKLAHGESRCREKYIRNAGRARGAGGALHGRKIKRARAREGKGRSTEQEQAREGERSLSSSEFGTFTGVILSFSQRQHTASRKRKTERASEREREFAGMPRRRATGGGKTPSFARRPPPPPAQLTPVTPSAIGTTSFPPLSLSLSLFLLLALLSTQFFRACM